MYKVYQDPEGTQCLEQCHGTSMQVTNKSICSETEEAYKTRIEGLNEEIKVLNDELQMVTTNTYIAS